MISKTVDLGGSPLHYADFGGAGPTLVLVHGLGGSHANWLALGPELARRARVVALDLPGFGRSPRPKKGTNLATMGRALAAFIDAQSTDPVHLVSNSMGSTLSLLEARARPERIASNLLVCPALPPPLDARADPLWLLTLAIACSPGGHLLLRRRAKRFGPEAQVKDLVNLCCADRSRVPEAVYQSLVDLARERASTTGTELAFCEATRSLVAQLYFGRPLRQALRVSTPPTLIVQGQKDRLVDPRGARTVASANPRFELTELPDLGHCPQLDAAGTIAEITGRWLDRVAS